MHKIAKRILRLTAVNAISPNAAMLHHYKYLKWLGISGINSNSFKQQPTLDQ